MLVLVLTFIWYILDRNRHSELNALGRVFLFLLLLTGLPIENSDMTNVWVHVSHVHTWRAFLMWTAPVTRGKWVCELTESFHTVNYRAHLAELTTVQLWMVAIFFKGTLTPCFSPSVINFDLDLKAKVTMMCTVPGMRYLLTLPFF